MLALAAGAMGFALNSVGIPIFGGTELVFGGIPVLLVCCICGPWWGLLSATIAFTKTWLSWGHGMGMACYGLEAWVIGWLLRHRRMSLITASASYWVLVGTPLAAVYFLWVAPAPFPANLAIICKYPANGLLAALVAIPLLVSTRFRTWAGLAREEDSLIPLRNILLRRFGAIAALPIVALVMIFGSNLDHNTRAKAATVLRRDADSAAARLQGYLAEHQRALAIMARLWSDRPPNPAQLSNDLEILRQQQPGFLTLLVADPSGLVIAAAPAALAAATLPREGLNVADRDYFRIPVAQHRAYMSDVFRGRGFGSDLIVALSVPVLDPAGNVTLVLEGSMNLSTVIQSLRLADTMGRRNLIIVDGAQQVVAATPGAGLSALDDIRETSLYQSALGGEPAFSHDLLRPGASRAERYLAARSQLVASGWQIYLEEPLWDIQRSIAGFYVASIVWVALAIGVLMLLARATAAEITRPLEQLLQSTQALAQGRPLTTVDQMTYPARELSLISQELQTATLALSTTNSHLASTMQERDKSHEELEQLLLHLDEKVRDRTKELEQARLTAEAANLAKTNFVTMISHEVRTPLNSVIGLATLLEDTALEVNQREMIHALRNSGESMLDLINRLLDLAKIEAGRLELEIGDCDLQDLLDRVLESHAPRAHLKGLELVGILGPGVPAVVRADGARLRQVLANLLGNAIKFTSQGEVGIEISVTTASVAPVSVCFEVTDTGSGIAEHDLARLFKPFSQLSSSGERAAGTGLGLAISQQLVGLMGGNIEVQSAAGAGTTFSFTLLLPSAPPARTSSPDVRLAKLSGLYVSPHPRTRMAIAGLLQRLGVTSFSETATAALRRLREPSPGNPPPRFILIDDRADADLLQQILSAAAQPGRTFPTRVGVLSRYTSAASPSYGAATTLTRPPRLAPIRDWLTASLAADANAGENSESGVETIAAKTVSLKILVAEDEVNNQHLMSLYLKKLGHAADFVQNGRQVVNAWENKDYDAILMDCQMPELDGLAATAEIRWREQARGGHITQHIRIIAVTANAITGERERCLAAGMDDYVTKPIRFELLRAALQRGAEGLTGAKDSA